MTKGTRAMGWIRWLGLAAPDAVRRPVRLRLETLEHRDPAAGVSATLAAGTLTLTGTAGNDKVLITAEDGLLIVTDNNGVVGKYRSAAVTQINVATGAGADLVKISSLVTQRATIDGGAGKNTLQAGGGPTTLLSAGATSKVAGGYDVNTISVTGAETKVIGGNGPNAVTIAAPDATAQRLTIGDLVAATAGTTLQVNNPRPALANFKEATISAGEVGAVLQRAAAATASNDAIIAVVDRNGRILGVRVEGGVDPAVRTVPDTRVFAVDGAVALARTAAFFSSTPTPLTSRTIRVLSQSTITQREVESNPNVTNVNSTLRGPGYVAPVGVGGHFPPGVPNTPEVDLFGIEHSNRDGRRSPGADRVIGTGDDLPLAQRFNVNAAFVPAGQQLAFLDSYGVARNPGLVANGRFQNRGIATLPGGVPIYRNNQLIGGIGVFFPGKTGYATESNSALSSTFDPRKPDRTLEAELIAVAALGGNAGARRPVGTLGGVAKPAGFDIPNGRIDLVGITLDSIGPHGADGIRKLFDLAPAFGFNTGNPNSGMNLPVNPAAQTLIAGTAPPSGWLVTPHGGNGVTAAEVTGIVNRGIAQANRTRAAIRLPMNSSTRMVFAVADRDGAVVGLYRMTDATVFSIDVAVAKARNVNYYADPTELKPIDQLPGVPAGVAFSNRTFRYLALPRYPSTADGTPPGPFSILRDGGSNNFTGLQQGARLPASAFKSVYGYDSFFPGTNFHDTTDTANANGVIFFPGSAPLYGIGRGLIGGFGVSGDGVDQDDVVTFSGQQGFESPAGVYANDIIYAGVRLPYMKFNRNPEAL